MNDICYYSFKYNCEPFQIYYLSYFIHTPLDTLFTYTISESQTIWAKILSSANLISVKPSNFIKMTSIRTPVSQKYPHPQNFNKVHNFINSILNSHSKPLIWKKSSLQKLKSISSFKPSILNSKSLTKKSSLWNQKYCKDHWSFNSWIYTDKVKKRYNKRQ